MRFFEFLNKLRLYFLFIVLRCCGIDLIFEELKARKYKRTEKKKERLQLLLKANSSSETMLDFAEKYYETENERQKRVDEKYNALLLITTLLVPIYIAICFAEKTNAFLLIVNLLSIVLLFISLWMLIEYLSVNTYSIPTPYEILKTNSNVWIRKQLIRDYLISTEENSLVHDFLVDLFQASKSILFFSLLLLMLSTVVGNFQCNSIEIGKWIFGIMAKLKSVFG